MSGTMDHANITVKIDAKNLNLFGLATSDDPVLKDYSQLFGAGTGANQASQQWHSLSRTLGASASENLDLAGVLTNAFGQVVTFTKIKALGIKAAAGNTNDVVVGGAASNGFITWVGGATHTVKVKPGGFMLLIAPDVNGYAVTAGTGDILQVANGGAGTSVSYDIYLLGTD